MANPRRANGSQRDKVRAQVLAEEDLCWICNEPVDKTLTFVAGRHGPRCPGDGCWGCVPHEMRAEVDEVHAVTDGGSPFDRSNCRLSHRHCNRERHQGKPRSSVVGDPFPLSSIWSGYPWGSAT